MKNGRLKTTRHKQKRMNHLILIIPLHKHKHHEHVLNAHEIHLCIHECTDGLESALTQQSASDKKFARSIYKCLNASQFLEKEQQFQIVELAMNTGNKRSCAKETIAATIPVDFN